MFTFARMLVILLFACATAISVFGQTVRLIEGEWRDITPSKTGTKSAEEESLFRYQREMFDRTGMLRAWDRFGLSISRLEMPLVVYIDTGIDANHPELAGLVDCELSETFIEGGGNPCVDEWGHGTAVASVGHAGDKMRGFSRGRIISFKVMVPGKNAFGQPYLRTSLDAVIAAFRRVKELGETFPLIIVNTSFSIDGVDPMLNALMKELEEQGRAFIVAATDNVVLDSERLPGLPCAASPRTNVFCVGSLTMKGNLASWSAYGNRINHSGRCDNIVASYPGPRYGMFTGNSGCAPQVSAVSAMVVGYVLTTYGRQLDASELKNLMFRGAAFAPGLVSTLRQQEILFPITLDVERLLVVADKIFSAKDPTIRPLSVLKPMSAESLKDTEGKTLLEISPKTYQVRGSGFEEGMVAVFLNGLSVEARVISETELEIKLGHEITFFTSTGGNVLYLLRLDEDGEVDPYSLVRILSGFNIR